MRLLIASLIVFVVGAQAQQPAPYPPYKQPVTVVAAKFFGSGAPGIVLGNLPGDLYNDTAASNLYVCEKPLVTVAPACTAVAANNWVLVNGGGGTGTVTSVATGCGLTGGPVTTTGTMSGTGACYAAGGGTAQAQTATYSPAITLTAGQWACWLPLAANTGPGATFSPSGLTAHTIVKAGGALVANDIITTAVSCAVYDATGTQWELQNPQTVASGTVTNISTGCGLTGGPATSTATFSETVGVNAQNTSYTILTGDCAKIVSSNTTATYTLPQAGSAGFSAGWFAFVLNTSASSSVTINTTTSTFSGCGFSGSSATVAAGSSVMLASSGGNWVASGCGGTSPVTSGTLSYSFVFSGASLANGSISGVFVMPTTCTLAWWNISTGGTADTATFKVLKRATGTTSPTVADSVNTSGVPITTGTNVRSATLADFTTTTFTQYDLVAVDLSAYGGVSSVDTFSLGFTACQ